MNTVPEDCLIEAQELVGDPEAIARGYLSAKIVNLAQQMADEILTLGLPRAGVGSPYSYWIKSSPIYEYASESLKTREMTCFEKLAEHYLGRKS